MEPSRLRALLPAHLRVARLLPLYVILALVAWLALLEGAVEIWRWEGLVSAHLLIAPGTGNHVADAAPGVAVAPGDELLEVGSRPFRDARGYFETLQGSRSEARVPHLFRKPDGTTLRLDLPLGPHRHPLSLSAFVCFICALVLLWLRPEGGESLAVYALLIGTAANLAFAFSTFIGPIAIFACFVGLGALTAGLLNMALLLPWPLRWLRRQRHVPKAIYGVLLTAGTVGGLHDAAGVLFGTGPSWWTSEWLFSVTSVLVGGAALFFIGSLVARIFAGPSALERRQLITLLGAAGLIVLYELGLGWSAVAPSTAPQGLHWMVSVLVSLSPVLLTAVVFADGLVAVNRSTTRSTFAGLWLVLALGPGPLVLTFLLQGGVPHDWVLAHADRRAAVVALYALAVVVGYIFARRVSRARPGTAAARGQAILDSCQTFLEYPPERGAGLTERILKGLFDLESVDLLLPLSTGSDGDPAWRRARDGQPVSVDSTAYAEERFLGLVARQRMVGALLLGRRRDRTPMSLDDRALLSTVAHTAASALDYRERGGHLGGFELVGFLGEGGLGLVHIGLDPYSTASRQLVAIKQIRDERLTPEHIALFEKECDIAGRMRHGNIARLVDYGKVDEAWYLAMAYVQGANLRQILSGLGRTQAQLPLEVAAYVVVQLCQALQYAHAGSPRTRRPALIHRDISPDNVLVDTRGRVLLSDFGVAALCDEPTQPVMGKPSYLAPEAISHGVMNRATDLYALGVLAIELFAGKHPFAGLKGERLRDAILIGRPPGFVAGPSVPAEVRALLLRAIHRTPEERFPSVASFGAAVRHAVPYRTRVASAELGRLVLENTLQLGFRRLTPPKSSSPQDEVSTRAVTAPADPPTPSAPVDDARPRHPGETAVLSEADPPERPSHLP